MDKSPLWQLTNLPSLVSIGTVEVEVIMILGYHVISQDHVIEGSCNFMGRSLSR